MGATESSTIERLLTLAAKQFKVERTTLSANDDVFESLGIDSVQVLELLSELEMSFDVEIPDYELRDVKTFEALAKVIDRRL